MRRGIRDSHVPRVLPTHVQQRERHADRLSEERESTYTLTPAAQLLEYNWEGAKEHVHGAVEDCHVR
jgi:hypothetical protein